MLRACRPLQTPSTLKLNDVTPQLHVCMHVYNTCVCMIVGSTSEGGVFSDRLSVLVYHSLSVAVISSDEQNIARLLTRPLDLTDGLV